MRILTIDIETFPLEVYTWGIWNQNVGINQIKNPGGLLSFAAKFHGERKVHFHSLWGDGLRPMIVAAHRLMSEADVVMGWNSDKFDIRHLQAMFIHQRMAEATPFAKVDLLKSVRRKAYLPSYKLDYVAQWLGIGSKVKTGGFELWRDVMGGCEKAQARMRRYNIHDTRLTEQVFDRLNERGWVQGLPNASIDGGRVCINPVCQSENLIRRGFNVTKTRKYQRWQCKECGTFCSDTHSEPGSARFKAVA